MTHACRVWVIMHDVLVIAVCLCAVQTDSLIQRTIRRVFAERATLTIAHRLDTIIFSDKILAMAQGQVCTNTQCSLIVLSKRLPGGTRALCARTAAAS